MSETVIQQTRRLKYMLLCIGVGAMLFNAAAILLIIDIHAAVVTEPKNVEAAFYATFSGALFGMLGLLVPTLGFAWDRIHENKSSVGGVTDAN